MNKILKNLVELFHTQLGIYSHSHDSGSISLAHRDNPPPTRCLLTHPRHPR